MATVNLLNNKADTLYIITPNGVTAEVALGGTKCECVITNRITGDINFRTQIDIAAGGTRYVVDAGSGLGTCSFTVLEGPFEKCDKTGAVSTSVLSAMNIGNSTLTNRTIKLTVSQSAGNVRTFDGHVKSAEYKVISEDQYEAITLTITAVGIWS